LSCKKSGNKNVDLVRTSRLRNNNHQVRSRSKYVNAK